jgi:hypothetical protein
VSNQKPHEILEIAEDATLLEAKQAFRRKMQKAHPDKEGGSIEATREIMTALRDFAKVRRCVCKGKGWVEMRQGLAVLRIPCPECWR